MLLADDTVNRALGSGMLWIGILIGFSGGIAFQAMRAAYKGWQGAKAAVPGARKGFVATIGGFVKITLVLAVAVAISVIWLIGWRAGTATPAQAPTAPPSSSPR